MSRALERLGLIELGERMEGSGAVALASIACFALVLLTSWSLVVQALPDVLVTVVHNAALAGTFILSGVPQTVEALAIAGSGKLDTHVLMSLAVLGTLYLGMAAEVSRPERRPRCLWDVPPPRRGPVA